MNLGVLAEEPSAEVENFNFESSVIKFFKPYPSVVMRFSSGKFSTDEPNMLVGLLVQ